MSSILIAILSKVIFEKLFRRYMSSFFPVIFEECVEIPIDADMSAFSSEDFLRQKNITVNGISLVEATLLFSIKSIHFKPNGPLNGPDCYSFDLALLFNNQGEDGQLLVSLTTSSQHVDCHGKVNPPVTDGPSKSFRSTVNIFVIFTCAASFFLCARAVIKAQLLKWVYLICLNLL